MYFCSSWHVALDACGRVLPPPCDASDHASCSAAPATSTASDSPAGRDWCLHSEDMEFAAE